MLRYKLRTDEVYDNVTEQILCSRGIDDVNRWISANKTDINNFEMLDDIEEGILRLKKVIDNWEDIVIIVDPDCDGYCSSAIFINFLYSLYPEYVNERVTFLHHDGKEHGIDDMLNKIPEWPSLLVVPDGGTSNYEAHRFLCMKDIYVLILDHHEAEYKSKYYNVTTINPQLDDYPNKAVCGGFVTWQFCRAYNAYFNLNGNLSTDLMALSMIGDMMDYRQYETRAAIKLGIEDIRNPFFYSMVEKNKFSINKMGGINALSLAFYVVPFINAIVRSGTSEEKKLIFNSMCIPYAYTQIESGKRGAKGQMVPLYEEAVRIVGNVKNRQTKLQNEAMNLLEQRIEEQCLLDNAFLLLCCEPGEVEKNIAGLAANKIQAKYQRPCAVLTRSKTKDDNEYFYRGSARNYSMSEIEDLKSMCEDSELIEWAQGHMSAYGLSIPERNIEKFIEYTNNIYKDTSKEPIYWVDYILDEHNCSPDFILDIANTQKYYGQNVGESKVCLNKIDLSKCKITLCGQKMNTIRMILPNGLVAVIFQQSEEEYEKMISENTYLTAICSPKVNEWNGEISGEVIIDDYELTEEWIF